MAEFEESNADQIVEYCRENADSIAESINACFGGDANLQAGDPTQWSDVHPQPMKTPGLIAVFAVGETGVAVLIPESLPLPGWCLTADVGEETRLQTLVIEWSMNLLPADFECGDYELIQSDDLFESIREMAPLDWARRLPLIVESDADSTVELSIVWPLSKLPTTSGDDTSIPRDVQFGSKAVDAAIPSSAGSNHGPGDLQRLQKQMRQFPVTVSVRVAQKRVHLDTLLRLMPGAVISFEKPCEDLLDLYVNNFHYCRGEAVKIGENFGLKINYVGIEDEREERVINV